MKTTKQYFRDCTTLDSAKNLFRKLSFELHPDTSGSDTEQDFIIMFKQFKAFRPSSEFYRENDDKFNADVFYNTVKRFESLQNTLISFIGSFIWLEDQKGYEGATKSQKEEIKKILIEGMNPPRFASKRKKWFYSPLGYKQKINSKKTFEEIKSTWGSKTYKPTARPQQMQLS
mgnify:CR=1 FL=1|tara:strand:- start:6044 stop:6562 length:519 start_codon:yes stop_codon:yes gene_type:complete